MPSIKWIGVYPSEIKPLKLTRQPLSEADKKKINDTLRPNGVSGGGGAVLPEDVARELRVAQEGAVKAEIEGLYDVSDNYLIDTYLAGKIRGHLAD